LRKDVHNTHEATKSSQNTNNYPTILTNTKKTKAELRHGNGRGKSPEYELSWENLGLCCSNLAKEEKSAVRRRRLETPVYTITHKGY